MGGRDCLGVLRVCAFLALFPLPPLFAANPPEAPGLCIKVRELLFNFPVQYDGKAWIQSSSEIEILFPLPLESIRSVMSDYEGYTAFTPRLREVHVLNRDGCTTLLSEKYSVDVLGFHFPAEYARLLVCDDTALPRLWRQSWTLAYSDGSIGATTGEWVLEACASEGGIPLTRATIRNRALVRKNFPLQLSIMRSVCEAELRKNYTAIYLEIRRRSRTAGSAPPLPGES